MRRAKFFCQVLRPQPEVPPRRRRPRIGAQRDLSNRSSPSEVRTTRPFEPRPKGAYRQSKLLWSPKGLHGARSPKGATARRGGSFAPLLLMPSAVWHTGTAPPAYARRVEGARRCAVCGAIEWSSGRLDACLAWLPGCRVPPRSRIEFCVLSQIQT